MFTPVVNAYVPLSFWAHIYLVVRIINDNSATIGCNDNKDVKGGSKAGVDQHKIWGGF